MDLPDAYPLRNRGLPVDRDLSPVRLHMPSEANSDLERYGSLDAAVAIKRKAAQSLPASPGWNEEEETQRRPPPPQSAIIVQCQSTSANVRQCPQCQVKSSVVENVG